MRSSAPGHMEAKGPVTFKSTSQRCDPYTHSPAYSEMTNDPSHMHAWAQNRLTMAYVPMELDTELRILLPSRFVFGCFAQSDDNCGCQLHDCVSCDLQTAKTYILAADLPGVPRERVRVGTESQLRNLCIGLYKYLCNAS